MNRYSNLIQSKKTLLGLGIVYLILNLFAVKGIEKNHLFASLISEQKVQRLFGENFNLVILILSLVVASFTMILMSFLYHNLLKFFFPESNSDNIVFCYLISIITGILISVILLQINPQINLVHLAKITNITSVVVINTLFILFNRKLKDELLVAIISISNACLVILI